MSVAVYTIRDAAWKGDLPFVRAGKRFVFDQQDLDKWAERRKERFGWLFNGASAGRATNKSCAMKGLRWDVR